MLSKEGEVSPRPAPRARKWAFRAVSGALIFALVLSHRDTLREVGAALGSVSPLVLLASVLFYWLGQLLSAYRWQQLLRARGVPVSLANCCQLYLAGMFGNLWLPTNIGGDALRATRLSQAHAVSLADAMASIAVERLTGFAALLFLAALGLLFRDARGDGLSLLLSAVLILLGLVIFWKILGHLAGKSQSRPAQKLRSLRQSLDFYAQPHNNAASCGYLSFSRSSFKPAKSCLISVWRAPSLSLFPPRPSGGWPPYFPFPASSQRVSAVSAFGKRRLSPFCNATSPSSHPAKSWRGRCSGKRRCGCRVCRVSCF